MSFEAQKWVMDHSGATGPAKSVLIVIAWHAHPDGTGSWPGLKLLASESGFSKGTVIAARDRLIELGEIESTQRWFEGGKQKTNEYRVVMGSVRGTGDEPLNRDARGTGDELQGFRRRTARGTGDEPPLRKNRQKEPLVEPSLLSSADDEAQVLAVWGERRGPLPAVIAKPKPARAKLIRAAGLAVGEAWSADDEVGRALQRRFATPWATLGEAIALAATNPHYVQNGYGVDTFCRHVDHWLELVVAGRTTMAPPPPALVGQPVSAAKQRVIDREAKYGADAVGRISLPPRPLAIAGGRP